MVEINLKNKYDQFQFHNNNNNKWSQTMFDIHGQWTEFLDRNRISKRQIDCVWFFFFVQFRSIEAQRCRWA